MTPPPGQRWNELGLSEDPLVELLVRLGFTYVAPETLETERESLKEPILTRRLDAAVGRINPWLTPENRRRAVRALTHAPAAGLLEANETAYDTFVHGTSVEQDRGQGKKSHDVAFVDWTHPRNNDLVVTRQYRVQGAKTQIRPDVVLFVNGVPIAVIECKSPTLGEKWKHDAVDQLLRYQEATEAKRDRGAPQLFHTAQILVATCGQAAVYGTVLTPERFYAEWKTVHPRSDDEVATLCGRTPSPQDVLLAGMFDPANLLDLVRNFTVFERDEKTGRTIKKVCRYQQFAAVNKAIERARRARRAEDRGGVVWHTQGSGKSLTMLWLALKLRRDERQENPTLVLVTDRVDLDDQIEKTFHACRFPNPKKAESVRELKALLSGPPGQTILTTVHKFQDATGKGTGKRATGEYPTLSTATNVFVLTDEAHRTQYGSLAANMRKALPNAAFFGFTGTPIDKKDKSTLTTFGPYIDQYTIEQAVADGATLPIFYESRLPELRILGSSLDALFDRVFADRSDEEREAIRKKYAKESAIAGAPKRVEAVCLDLLDHFTKHIQPGGFKAQIVTVSREVAVLYKETLDRLNGPESAVVMSGTNDDEAHLARHHTDKDQRKALIQRFLKGSDPLSILVVCDMLLTGFDAPIEQVMYLDAPLKEHTLLQAIARVNRTAENKTYGLIVDYWGVSEALEEALAIFSPSDVAGAMKPATDELPRLEQRHHVAVAFFARVKDKDDLDACVAVLGAEDVRADFDQAFRRFSQSLDMVLPDPKGSRFVGDLRWLGKIRGAAAARYRDPALDISDCAPKVRKLIEDAIAVDGIEILVKQVNLFTPEFEQRLAALKSDEAKASEMEHAIKDEIHVKLEEDPAFYTSLRERLEQIVEDRKARRIDAAKQLELYAAIHAEMKDRGAAAQSLGLSDAGLAIYGLLAPKPPLTAREPVARDDRTVDLASLLDEALRPQTEIVDWTTKEEVQKEMRRRIKRQLSVAQYDQGSSEKLAASIVELLKKRSR